MNFKKTKSVKISYVEQFQTITFHNDKDCKHIVTAKLRY